MSLRAGPPLMFDGLLADVGKEAAMVDRGGRGRFVEALQGVDAACAASASFGTNASYEANADDVDGSCRTIALTVSYDGEPFSGFARQPGQLTVQGSLEQALGVLFRREVSTVCAGRTDAGVHARGQVVSFDVSEEEMRARTPRSLMRSLNALVDDRIAIRAVQEAPRGFSARFDAVEREYRYFICTAQARPVLLSGRVWHFPRPLDVPSMRAGAAHLIGEHDFKSFCMAVSAEGKPTCRFVREIAVDSTSIFGEEEVICIRVIGNAFLHSMVRTIVGTLVAVGSGKRDPDWVAQALAACDRRAAGETAPACGLVFWEVRYEGEDGSVPIAEGPAWA